MPSTFSFATLPRDKAHLDPSVSLICLGLLQGVFDDHDTLSRCLVDPVYGKSLLSKGTGRLFTVVASARSWPVLVGEAGSATSNEVFEHKHSLDACFKAGFAPLKISDVYERLVRLSKRIDCKVNVTYGAYRPGASSNQAFGGGASSSS